MYGLYLGTDPSKTASYKGYMDDVRIYNRVLSDTDVATLYAHHPPLDWRSPNQDAAVSGIGRPLPRARLEAL